jgi:hypothetical protein
MHGPASVNDPPNPNAITQIPAGTSLEFAKFKIMRVFYMNFLKKVLLKAGIETLASDM